MAVTIALHRSASRTDRACHLQESSVSNVVLKHNHDYLPTYVVCTGLAYILPCHLLNHCLLSRELRQDDDAEATI